LGQMVRVRRSSYVPWNGKNYKGYAFVHERGARAGKVCETRNGLRLFIEGRYDSYRSIKAALEQIAWGLPVDEKRPG
jgi:hypothetical protein